MQKTIFITGASSGLGKTAAKLFHSKGWNVIATMRNPERETELRQFENIKLFRLDVSEKDEIENMISELLENYTIDVVLNNAGYGLIGPLEAFSDEQMQKQIDTNVMGVIRVTKAFTPYFRLKNQGVFINITSTFGFMGFPTCSVYSAAKFAVDGFSECMAYELAQFNIKVKVVAPGGIQTDFAGRSIDGASHDSYQKIISKVQQGYSPEQIAKYSKPEDIAQVIFEAATDGENQFRYIAGKDARELYNERLTCGAEKQVQKIRSEFVF